MISTKISGMTCVSFLRCCMTIQIHKCHARYEAHAERRRHQGRRVFHTGESGDPRRAASLIGISVVLEVGPPMEKILFELPEWRPSPRGRGAPKPAVPIPMQNWPTHVLSNSWSWSSEKVPSGKGSWRDSGFCDSVELHHCTYYPLLASHKGSGDLMNIFMSLA